MIATRRAWTTLMVVLVLTLVAAFVVGAICIRDQRWTLFAINTFDAAVLVALLRWSYTMRRRT